MTSNAVFATSHANAEPTFSESAAWKSTRGEWRQLSGNFRERGYSVEWHDFNTEADLDWSQSFHPAGLEICFNLSGTGEVRAGSQTLELGKATGGFYAQQGPGLKAVRRAGQPHQFITVELSLPFLKSQISSRTRGLHPCLGRLLSSGARTRPAVSEPLRLTSLQQEMVAGLRRPPVLPPAREMWYHAKVLEIAATLLFQPTTSEEFFCQRIKKLNKERALKVVALLKQNLSAPPPLEELGRQVGCSHFHLSRIFAQEMGHTISVCLRQLRLERAAELLRTGQCNVSEAAFEVGYNSLSHFTVAFRETFGCCPGLYPVKKSLQLSVTHSQAC